MRHIGSMVRNEVERHDSNVAYIKEPPDVSLGWNRKVGGDKANRGNSGRHTDAMVSRTTDATISRTFQLSIGLIFGKYGDWSYIDRGCFVILPRKDVPSEGDF